MGCALGCCGCCRQNCPFYLYDQLKLNAAEMFILRHQIKMLQATARFTPLRLPSTASNPLCLFLSRHRRRHHHQHWLGLHQWRTSPLNPIPEPQHDNSHLSSSLAEFGSLILSTPDPLTKARLSHLAFSRWHQRQIPVGSALPPPRPAPLGPPNPSW